MKRTSALKKKRIGERLRLLRGKRQQTEMAQYLQVTQSYLSQVELGKKTPSLETLLYLSEKYHTTVGFLLGETNDPRQSQEERKNTELKDEQTSLSAFSASYPQLAADTKSSALTLSSILRDKLLCERVDISAKEASLLRSILQLCILSLSRQDGKNKIAEK